MGKLFKVPGGEYLVDSEDYEIRKDEFGRPILCPLNQGGGGEQPKLYTPEIKITGDTLTIIPNTDNGAFVSEYNGYMSVDGGDFELYGTLPSDQLELDLTAVGLPDGDFQFKATAIGTNFQESDASNVEDYTNIFYSVTNTLTNCTSNNSATSVRKGSAYSATLTAEAGYTMNGATVTVTMGGVDITSTAYADGKIAISGINGNIIIVVTAKEVTELSFASATLPQQSTSPAYAFASGLGKTFYYPSKSNTVYFTADGITWDAGTSSNSPLQHLNYGTDVIYSGAHNRFYAVSSGPLSNRYFMKSVDGVEWDTISRLPDSLWGAHNISAASPIRLIESADGTIFIYGTSNSSVLKYDGTQVALVKDEATVGNGLILADGVFYTTRYSNKVISIWYGEDLSELTQYSNTITVDEYHSGVNSNSLCVFNGKIYFVVNGHSTSQEALLYGGTIADGWTQIPYGSDQSNPQYHLSTISTNKFLAIVPDDTQNKDVSTVRYFDTVTNTIKATTLPSPPNMGVWGKVSPYYFDSDGRLFVVVSDSGTSGSEVITTKYNVANA